ncbi:hypothetical protein TBR22_A13640 [Luteitalea sp. TBR-22]|uniref:GDSL-type esterase/lipase family protein n=1 Tax=Luteitalea sp. TBR-22 TaxID=2802971 RepID=UPI001AFA2A30|nr:GDSL-type esterase/lipase family protein [Luteitalea sp. TBR-22]BCS32154.1 hypothetical protein TBR22_A13640 [Luteitalea sp. TBR-22]
MATSPRLAASLALLLTVLACASPRAEAQAALAPATPQPLDLSRFEKDILAFEAADRATPPPQGAILFVGSSIFRLWKDLPTQMAPLPVINRAFGGSRTPEQLHYFERIVLPYRPRVIVYYCGSNDVNAGETAQAIAARVEQFSERVRTALPGTRVYFASIIKAPQKRDRWDVVDRANALVRAHADTAPGRGYIDLNPALQDERGEPLMDLYLADRLHYLPPAYERISAVVKPVVAQAWSEVARP